MRIVFVSDTHEQHGQLTQALISAKADVLVHCGDATGVGALDRVEGFADWCAMLLRKGYVRHVVFVAGNHDCTLDARHPRSVGSSREVALALLEDAGVHYLEDSGAEIDGVRFYGVPWTGRFFDWAFQIDTPEQDASAFDRVPDGIDVLITHGPALGIRDLVPDGRLTGSPALLRAIARVRPRVHAFGHIHCGYGMSLIGPTLHINASSCTEAYRPTNPPIVVDLA